MTRDQLAFLAAVLQSNASMTDDEIIGNPQQTVDQYMKYLDTYVPANQSRMKSYESTLGMDFGGSGGGITGEALESLLGDNGVPTDKIGNIVSSIIGAIGAIK